MMRVSKIMLIILCMVCISCSSDDEHDEYMVHKIYVGMWVYEPKLGYGRVEFIHNYFSGNHTFSVMFSSDYGNPDGVIFDSKGHSNTVLKDPLAPKPPFRVQPSEYVNHW